jgi:hypothetical protein
MTKDRKQILLGATLTTAVAIALGALAVAIIALNKDQADATRLHTIQAQVRTIVANEGSSELQSKLSFADSQLTNLQSKIAGLVTCVPELQAEVAGLSISWKVYGPYSEKEDYFNIVSTSQLSNNCDKPLLGSGE